MEVTDKSSAKEKAKKELLLRRQEAYRVRATAALQIQRWYRNLEAKRAGRQRRSTQVDSTLLAQKLHELTINNDNEPIAVSTEGLSEGKSPKNLSPGHVQADPLPEQSSFEAYVSDELSIALAMVKEKSISSLNDAQQIRVQKLKKGVSGPTDIIKPSKPLDNGISRKRKKNKNVNLRSVHSKKVPDTGAGKSTNISRIINSNGKQYPKSDTVKTAHRLGENNITAESNGTVREERPVLATVNGNDLDLDSEVQSEVLKEDHDVKINDVPTTVKGKDLNLSGEVQNKVLEDSDIKIDDVPITVNNPNLSGEVQNKVLKEDSDVKIDDAKLRDHTSRNLGTEIPVEVISNDKPRILSAEMSADSHQIQVIDSISAAFSSLSSTATASEDADHTEDTSATDVEVNISSGCSCKCHNGSRTKIHIGDLVDTDGLIIEDISPNDLSMNKAQFNFEEDPVNNPASRASHTSELNSPMISKSTDHDFDIQLLRKLPPLRKKAQRHKQIGRMTKFHYKSTKRAIRPIQFSSRKKVQTISVNDAPANNTSTAIHIGGCSEKEPIDYPSPTIDRSPRKVGDRDILYAQVNVQSKALAEGYGHLYAKKHNKNGMKSIQSLRTPLCKPVKRKPQGGYLQKHLKSSSNDPASTLSQNTGYSRRLSGSRVGLFPFSITPPAAIWRDSSEQLVPVTYSSSNYPYSSRSLLDLSHDTYQEKMPQRVKLQKKNLNYNTTSKNWPHPSNRYGQGPLSRVPPMGQSSTTYWKGPFQNSVMSEEENKKMNYEFHATGVNSYSNSKGRSYYNSLPPPDIVYYQ